MPAPFAFGRQPCFGLVNKQFPYFPHRFLLTG